VSNGAGEDSNQRIANVTGRRRARARTVGSATVQRWGHVRDMLRELIARDMKLRYRGSLLGVAWTLLNPIAELLVLLFIFDYVLPLNIPNYGVFLFTGLLVYGWFQSSLLYATGAIVNNRELIKRPGVPASVLPIVNVASNLVHFVLALPVLFALVVTSGIELTGAVLALPLLIGIQFVLIVSLAYPVATAHVWFRDTQYLLRVALQLLFYLTPVFYEVSAIPRRYEALYRLNPMVSVVEWYRDVLLRGTMPSAASLLAVTGVAASLLVVGLVGFTRTSQRFADEL
jgi:homopolymeric O-antigen transport system permease protein